MYVEKTFFKVKRESFTIECFLLLESKPIRPLTEVEMLVFL